METLKASTQHGDWEGTAAADNKGQEAIQNYFRDHGLMTEDEFIIAISMYVKHASTSVRAVVLRVPSIDSVKASMEQQGGSLKVREVSVGLTSEEFLSLFERFNVVLTRGGLNLEGRKILPSA